MLYTYLSFIGYNIGNCYTKIDEVTLDVFIPILYLSYLYLVCDTEGVLKRAYVFKFKY